MRTRRPRRRKPTALLEKARAKPDAFADLAKANSQDPGSAAQGGDLGSFARGAMVKPFEDAVFAAKVGDIVGPVQTRFRLSRDQGDRHHAVARADVRRGEGQIEADLKRQKAAQKFAAAADQFQNLVYEQADSLAPVPRRRSISR